ncbi:MAG: 2-dehydropantoate 2-reductase [Gammaproteobacteria bacterium]|nr:2-dehydropantoate 2-reductase [Gammaproteobacteria bacterium]
MHCVILGAGALGALLAGHLSQAQHRVQLIARGARADHLEAHGVAIHGLSEITARCEVVRGPADVTDADLFINTVKTYDSVAALASLRHLQPRVALSVQNGVVKEDELCARFGRTAVLGTMADFSGEVTDDGSVLFTRNIYFHLGELDGSMSARAMSIATAINSAGINTRAVDNIQSIAWSKYTGWVALMVLAVLTRKTTGVYLSDPNIARLTAQIVREMAQLSAALHIPLIDASPIPVARVLAASDDDAVTVVQATGARMHAAAPTHRMSSLQDLLRGRRLELEETVGHALRKAAELDLKLPTLETCYRLASAV